MRPRIVRHRAARHSVVRHGVVRQRLDAWVDPARAFAGLHSADEQAFWLDGGIHADSGMSYLGTGSTVATASLADGTVTLQPSGSVLHVPILDFLREQLPVTSLESAGCPLGWVGWLGYEVRAQTTGVVVARASRYPDAAFLYVDRLLAFDHAARTVELIAIGESWAGELGRWRDATIEGIRLAVDGSGERPLGAGSAGGTQAVWTDTDEEYLAKIGACQHAIRDGEAYQLCLTTEVEVDARPDPLATYLALRAASPTHHGGFLRIAGVSLLSSSPEQFLSVSADRIVESRPIKGTRPRGSTPAEDLRLRAELESSDKERAENLMIVDLMRNDLGRVCEVGSVSVPSLLAVETYAQVHQLVSTVRGRLAAGHHPVDAVVSCFPAGSMTGAPKLRATEILDALEQRPRGLYSGAFGYFGLDGTIDLAMVIRSIVVDSRGATVGAGGGITALSVPEEELAEVKLKAAALLAVLGV